MTTASASWNFSRKRMSSMQVSRGRPHMDTSNQRGLWTDRVTVLARIRSLVAVNMRHLRNKNELGEERIWSRRFQVSECGMAYSWQAPAREFSSGQYLTPEHYLKSRTRIVMSSSCARPKACPEKAAIESSR